MTYSALPKPTSLASLSETLLNESSFVDTRPLGRGEAGRVEEVIARGTRIKGYIGCFDGACTDCWWSWAAPSESQACTGMRTYLTNSDGICYSCPATGGGGGGGGGGSARTVQDQDEDDDEAEEEEEEEDETTYLEGTCVRPLDVPLASFAAWLFDAARHTDLVVAKQVAGANTARITRTFSAKSRQAAASAALRYLAGIVEYVEGYVHDENPDPSTCSLGPVQETRYRTVHGRMTTSNWNRYHLFTRNCNDWVEEQRR